MKEGEKNMFCRNCGIPLNDGAKFCTSCGKAVIVPPSVPPSVPPTLPPAAPIQAPVQTPLYTPLSSTPPLKPKKKTGLIVVLSLCALLVVGLVVGGIFIFKNLSDGAFDSNKNGSDPTNESAAVVEDGVVTYDGAAIDFGDNEVPEDTAGIITAAELGSEELPDGLGSTLYDLYIDPAGTEPITIRIPIAEDLSELDEEAVPMIGIGTIVTYEDGSQATVYQYLEAEVKDETAEATFIPSETLGERYVRGSSDGTSSSGTPGKERVRAGIIWCSTTFTDGGHFLVYFPAQAHKFFIDYNDREALLLDLEAVYEQYLGMGYAYDGRSSWPMVVNIRNIDDDAAYTFGLFSADGSIDINRRFFEGGYNSAEVKALLAHEFFHFVQMNYVSSFNQCPWFDEATATYFESLERGSIPSIVGEYKENIFSGVIPEENTSANGYSRMPLISYLVTQTGGSEAFIQQAYAAAGSGTDWTQAITAATGDPALWAGGFYSALVSGTVGDYTPYMLHKNLAAGDFAQVGTSLALEVPSEEEIAAALENDDVPLLGTANVNVAAYGAQLVALTIDAENGKLLPDGMDPVVKVSGGADASVFAIKGSAFTESDVTGSGAPLTDFKKSSGDQYVFLVLITGLHAAGTQEYTVTVEMQQYPTLDELVGQYADGVLTITDVFISDTLREQMTAAQDEAADAENPLSDVGCDIEILGAIEAMVGQANPVILFIEKTGENTGNLMINSADPEEQSDPTPMPFVYEAGTLTFDFNIEGEIGKGAINARYGPNQTVTLNGGLRTTIESVPESDLYFDLTITGSKPIEPAAAPEA